MTRRRLLGTACAAAVLAVVAGAGPAQATSYRFWTYWHGTGSGWAFSPVGASHRPADGTVEGWRFAVSAAAGSRTPPRASVTFASVCGSAAAAEGRKRVALVVDFGTTADAPPGQRPPRGVDTFCADVATSANGYDVLQSYASVRAERGLVCAIAGYPAGECGAAVAPSASPAPTRTTRPPAASSSAPASSPSSATRPPAAPSASSASSASHAAPAAGTTSTAPSPLAPSGTATGDPTPVAVAAGGLADGPDDAGSGPWVPALLGGLAAAGLGLAGWRRGRRASG